MFSRCITLFSLQEMFGGIDPRSTEERGEVISISHHVMISHIEIVLDISPFVIGKEVAEWGVARSDRLVPTKLLVR